MVPPRVEYRLTHIGRKLIPICLDLHACGARHRFKLAGEVSTLSSLTFKQFGLTFLTSYSIGYPLIFVKKDQRMKTIFIRSF